MNSKTMHPRLVQTLYRSFLRASNRGKTPQVFGAYGAAVFSHQIKDQRDHESLAIPSTPQHVRQRLKLWFRDAEFHEASIGSSQNKVLEHIRQMPLDVLSHVNQQESIVTNQISDTGLPIFDYQKIAALPGERVYTLFVEPRYSDVLLKQVLASPSQQFLLRTSPNSSSATLMQLVKHSHINVPASKIIDSPSTTTKKSTSETPKGSKEERRISGVAVTALAGARVEIHTAKEVKIAKQTSSPDVGQSDDSKKEQEECWSTSTAPLAVATNYSLCIDEPISDTRFNHQTMTELRQYILNMFRCALELHELGLAETMEKTEFGLPPLEMEAFSFWALRFVLRTDHLEARRKWLHECRSTLDRLHFVVKEIEGILEAHEDENDEHAAIG